MFSTRQELVASVPRAIIVDQAPWLITLNINNRWDKPCLMVTSWPSWGRVMLATPLQSITLITTLSKKLSKWAWWINKQKEMVEAALLVQLHLASETTELEQQVELVIIRMLIRLICLTLSIRGKHQAVNRLPNNNKWWWQHSFSIHHNMVIMVCSQDQPVDTIRTIHQFLKQLLRPNSVNKEHQEVPATQSIKVTKVTSARMQLSINMLSIKCSNLTKQVINTILVIMLANNLCTAIRIWQPSNNSSILVTSSSTKPIKLWITIRALIQQQVEEESKQLITTLTHCTSLINRMLEVNSQMEEDQWVVLVMTHSKTDMDLFRTTVSSVMLKT